MVSIERLTNDVLPEGTVLRISNPNILSKQMFAADVLEGDLILVMFTHGNVVMVESDRTKDQFPIAITEDCFEPFDK